MKQSYLDYAMSVIVSRALPDVRDGLKPVHRRILYCMNEIGCYYNKPYRKSALVDGRIMGEYHPHGNLAVYDTMVRMVQPFSTRIPLLDGQGNFGSVDGDSAAADRYTEIRLAKIAHQLLEDIDYDTVDFQPNYDGSRLEPLVLPARFPNLLVNGVSGIAVGMATNIAPHNLSEIIDACIYMIENPNYDLFGIMQHVKGPDFPTGGIILNRAGILSAYKTGRGSVMLRSRIEIEETKKDRQAIVVSEIPYQVNKAKLVEKIAECVATKIIEGISDLRDESDRDGMRIVIELKKDVNSGVVLNQLYKHTQMQASFSFNMLALNRGFPKLMNLTEILEAFIEFRYEVVINRTKFELKKSRARAHLLIGLAIAVANIDRVIAIIRKSPDVKAAKMTLLEIKWDFADIADLIEIINDSSNRIEDGYCMLTEEQVQSILDLKLQRLTALERGKISDELKELSAKIKELLEILASKERISTIVKEELLKVKQDFPMERLTSIEETDLDIDDEELIQREDMVVTVSHSGYVKRVPVTTYKAQRRGGKGKTGMTTKDEDFVHDVFVANTHIPVLFFSTRGIVYSLKVYKLPLATPKSRGKAFINLFPLQSDETISTVMPLCSDQSLWSSLDVVFSTSHGTIRRNKLTDFLNISQKGKIAMKLDNNEKLIDVSICDENSDVFISSKFGKSVKFPVSLLRVFNSRNSTGVRAVKLLGDDEVVSVAILKGENYTSEERETYIKYLNWLKRSSEDILVEQSPEKPSNFDEMHDRDQMILTITERGYAKITSAYEYRTTGRGAQGVKNINIKSHNGPVVTSLLVRDNDDVMLVTDSGKLIRCPVGGIRITSRNTQGVILFRVEADEKVVSAVRLSEAEDLDEALDGNNTLGNSDENLNTPSITKDINEEEEN